MPDLLRVDVIRPYYQFERNAADGLKVQSMTKHRLEVSDTRPPVGIEVEQRDLARRADRRCAHTLRVHKEVPVRKVRAARVPVQEEPLMVAARAAADFTHHRVKQQVVAETILDKILVAVRIAVAKRVDRKQRCQDNQMVALGEIGEPVTTLAEVAQAVMNGHYQPRPQPVLGCWRNVQAVGKPGIAAVRKYAGASCEVHSASLRIKVSSHAPFEQTACR